MIQARSRRGREGIRPDEHRIDVTVIPQHDAPAAGEVVACLVPGADAIVTGKRGEVPKSARQLVSGQEAVRDSRRRRTVAKITATASGNHFLGYGLKFGYRCSRQQRDRCSRDGQSDHQLMLPDVALRVRRFDVGGSGIHDPIRIGAMRYIHEWHRRIGLNGRWG